MNKITRDTLFKETREIFDERVPVSEQCSAFFAWLPKMESDSVTWGELSDGIRKDKMCQVWSMSVLHLFFDELDVEYRKEFIENIEDPVPAMCLYLDYNLTDSEDELLKAVFKGQLPRAEKELSDGIVMRAKK